MESRKIVLAVILIASMATAYFLLSRNTSEIAYGEAVIHYADYSGWIIETQNHVLLLDYIETQPFYTGIMQEDQPHTFENGYITQEALQGENVLVLVSHAHSDHYDPLIHDFIDWNSGIRYFFGWQVEGYENSVSITGTRETYSSEDFTIYTVNHPFVPENEPEVAYMISIDGLTIYHSGDLCVSDPEIKPEFKSNIDYLAEISDEIDIVFISMARGWYGNFTNGGDIYTITALNPKVVFPQHYPNSPINYEFFADEASAKGVDTSFGIASQRGDSWFYSLGDITKSDGED